MTPQPQKPLARWIGLVCVAIWIITTGVRCGGLVSECLQSLDCPSNQRCQAHQCVTAAGSSCQGHGECLQGYICVGAMCIRGQTCRSGASCEPNESCINHLCVPYAPCESPAEACNNLDDDCNGKIDEDLSRPCQTACGAGTETCSFGQWVACTARQPTAELCDGKDNDCDGKIDEGCDCTAGATRSCGKGVGVCAKGTQSCVNGKWDATCQGTMEPTAEICNNKDDDCDGATDEAITATCQQGCQSGTKTCTAGQWSPCQVGPSPQEVCDDNTDNDCDGQIDEGCPTGPQALGEWCDYQSRRCQAGLVCHGSLCHTPCDRSKGEVNNPACPAGHSCLDGPGQRGVCKKSCTKSKDCPKYMYCLIKTPACVPNSPPSEGTAQLNESCTTDGAQSTRCDGNKGLACVSGRCKKACDPYHMTVTCPSPQFCAESQSSFLGGFCSG